MSNIKRNNNIRHKYKIKIPTIIFTLFGAYIIPRGGEIWVGNLIKLLDTFDLSSNAVRIVLSRMSKQKLLKSRKKGRKSYYSLSKKGYEFMIYGRNKGLEREYKHWDKKWRFLIYSIPEKFRRKRDRLRKKLKSIGFGSLGPSIWLSPYDFKEELIIILDKMKLGDYVETFVSEYTGVNDEKDLVKKAWDIKGLEYRYKEFVNKYSAILSSYKIKIKKEKDIDLSKCFIDRFKSTVKFIDIALDDPMLPINLLPHNWIGYKAKKIHKGLRELLAEGANKFVDEILKTC
jgi:phenylacetic acid degradation operon negative regulatory protein